MYNLGVGAVLQGNVTQTVVPTPTSEVSPIDPPIHSAMDLHIGNPNPTPCVKESTFSKRSKINLDVSPEGYLTLKVPTKTSEDEIMTYMKCQSKFLLNLQEKLNNRKYISNQKSYDNEELFLNEAADLMYHYIVLLIAKGYGLEDVVRVLEGRHGKDKS